MTARQQLARLLTLVLLVALVIAGLDGTVAAPGWNGPLRGYGVPIGIALEVIFGLLLLVVRRRNATAGHAADGHAADGEAAGPPEALRFALRYVLGAGMVVIGVMLITGPRSGFFLRVSPPKPPGVPRAGAPAGPAGGHASAWAPHIPLAAIGYGLLIAMLVAATVASLWWSRRSRRPAAPLVVEDAASGELREALESGRSALAAVDDARAAIIACYVAMERSLADQGTARGVAETPDELLARAVRAGLLRGAAAGRLTSLCYEARFSTHPVTAGQRAAAVAALDELAGELAFPAAGGLASQGAGTMAGPGPA